MQLTQIPAKFTKPFADGAGAGYTRSIPAASQISVQGQAGAASLTDGFPPVCFLPVGSGGIPPSGQDFNGILNQDTAWARWQAAGGTVPFDQAFANAIGGYPYGAIVQSTTSGKLWFCTADNNTTNPDGSSPANWLAFGVTSASQLGPLRVPNNLKVFTDSTRRALSGTGTITAISGLTYAKQSATSLVTGVLLLPTLIQNSTPYGAAIVTLNVGSGVMQAILGSFYPSNAIPSTVVPFVLSGLSAGSQAISIQLSRTDGNSWQTWVNPTAAADYSGLPPTTTTVLRLEEVEP